MSYSVLVVDDEPFTRKYLKKAIPTLCGTFRTVDEAEHGKQALLAAQEHDYDLIIADICMPEMDGLELTERIKKGKPDQQIVILSGFEEFAYAQRAIQYGVTAYLLKPIEQEKLQQVLRQVENAIEKRRHVQKGTQNLQAIAKNYGSSIASDYLSALLSQDRAKIQILSAQIKQLQEPIFQENNILLSFSVGSTTLCEFSHSVAAFASIDYALLKSLQELLTEWGKCTARYFSHGNCRLVLLSTPNDIFAAVREVFDFLSGILRNGSGLAIVCGASMCFAGETDLHQAFHQAELARKRQWNTASEGLVFYSQLEQATDALFQFEFAKNSLLNSIMSRDNRLLGAALSEFLSYADRFQNTPLLAQCVSLLLPIRSTSFVAQITEPQIDHVLQELHDADNSGILRESLEGILKDLNEHGSGDQLAGNPQAEKIAMAKEYINANFSKQISLPDIAAYVELTPNYLSNVFRKYEKEGYIKYLTRVRMENACKLLIQFLAMKISDIAEKCGFVNVKHFYHVFARTYHCSPNTFRIYRK